MNQIIIIFNLNFNFKKLLFFLQIINEIRVLYSEYFTVNFIYLFKNYLIFYNFKYTRFVATHFYN